MFKQPSKKSGPMYHISDVWAAVAYADRVNAGQYVNGNTVFKVGEVVKNQNRTLVYQALDRSEIITEEDRKFGSTLESHFSGLLFRTIKGTAPITGNPLQGTSFLDTIASIVSMKEVGKYEIACMACLPSTYRKDLERERHKERMFELSAKSDYVGLAGSKQELEVRILETFYSKKYETIIVTATRGKDIVKFFSSKNAEDFPRDKVMSIKGTVKHASVNERTGGKETWLTRVKVVG